MRWIKFSCYVWLSGVIKMHRPIIQIEYSQWWTNLGHTTEMVEEFFENSDFILKTLSDDGT